MFVCVGWGGRVFVCGCVFYACTHLYIVEFSFTLMRRPGSFSKPTKTTCIAKLPVGIYAFHTDDGSVSMCLCIRVTVFGGVCLRLNVNDQNK